jgi:UDP-glucuronate decarboxylase
MKWFCSYCNQEIARSLVFPHHLAGRKGRICNQRAQCRQGSESAILISIVAQHKESPPEGPTVPRIARPYSHRLPNQIAMPSFKRILVTGGAGFLGSHLCQRLVADGHDVICIDNFFTSQKANLSELLDQPNFELIRHDVVHPIWLEVDEIYNLACPAAPGHYQYNPIKTMKTSVVGAINVLGMAKRCRAKVLQASTSEVYGDPSVHPQPESYRGSVNPIGPRACYDEGKRAAETLFMDYHRMNGVKIRIARIFNTYGPRMHPYDGRVVSNFIRQALEGKELTIFGDGAHTRSFCYRDDLVEGLIRLMNAPDDLIGPVNLGNPEEFTIGQLADMVLEMTDSTARLVHRPLPEDDPTKRRPDITLARKRLNWQPTVPLRDGLEKTIEWFRSIDMRHYRAPTPNY